MSSRNRHRRRSKKPGLSPGTLEFTGVRKVEKPLLMKVQYNEENFKVGNLDENDSLAPREGYITWLDVRGLHDVQLIERLGRQYDIHPLVLEDVLHTSQRPKFEEYGNEGFFIISALLFEPLEAELQVEQIAMYIGGNFLITFQEKEDDTFTAVRERLEVGKGRIRSRRADYLAYSLIDNIVDQYFIVLDQVEERIEQIEVEITSKPSRLTKQNIYRLKFQMISMRKAVTPLREAIGRFSRCEGSFLEESTGLFLRDLNDHVYRISDIVETYRDMLNSLQELYLAELSLRMNNVIQVLTIITTIFVPLTFLAGVYGMNFDYMPELRWRFGYFMVWGVFIVIAGGLVLYFKKKKWV